MGLVVLFSFTVADLPEEQDTMNLKGFCLLGGDRRSKCEPWACSLFSPRMPLHAGPGFY